MEFTILEIWYIILIVFTVFLWTLLSIILVKVIKILDVAEEITWYYTKIKKAVSVYNHVPEIVKEKLKSFF